MNVAEELHRAFDQLQAMLLEDQNAVMLDMSYAEFTLKCYAGYAKRIYATLLCQGAPLTHALCSIGVDQPHDQLLILLDTFYLHLRTAQNAIS